MDTAAEARRAVRRMRETYPRMSVRAFLETVLCAYDAVGAALDRHVAASLDADSAWQTIVDGLLPIIAGYSSTHDDSGSISTELWCLLRDHLGKLRYDTTVATAWSEVHTLSRILSNRTASRLVKDVFIEGTPMNIGDYILRQWDYLLPALRKGPVQESFERAFVAAALHAATVEDKRLAFAMGFHPRLGERSWIRALDASMVCRTILGCDDQL